LDAVEERARSELGMIRQDEIFFQVMDERRVNATPRK
jgi:cell division protein FtsB